MKWLASRAGQQYDIDFKFHNNVFINYHFIQASNLLKCSLLYQIYVKSLPKVQNLKFSS